MCEEWELGGSRGTVHGGFGEQEAVLGPFLLDSLVESRAIRCCRMRLSNYTSDSEE